MGASTRQLEVIDDLVRQLGLEGEIKAQVYAIAAKPDARPAVEVRKLISGLIDRKRARVAAAAAELRAAAPAREPEALGRGIWADVPDGRYALSAVALPDLAGGNDMVFVRVNTWTPPGKGPITFVRQLHGAPGAFNKTKLSAADNRRVRDAILDDTPRIAGLRFSRAYTRCARCLSELTDQRSRETGYGPDCREHMGLPR